MLALLLLAVLAVPAVAQPALRVGVPAGEVQVADALRAHAVALDVAALGQAADARQAVAFDLLGETVVVRPQRLDRRGPGRYTWSGPLDGGGRGLVTVEGDAVVARLVTTRGTFVVEPTRDGRHVAYVPGPEDERTDDWVPAPPASAPSASARVGEDTLFPDELHVALFYTRAVVDSLGPAMPAFLQATVDTFNDVLANSAVPLRARLVRTHEVTYEESGTMSTDLYSFASFGDGIMDDVQGVRDAAHADFAALITETGTNAATGCGVAFLMVDVSTDFADAAYSVTKRRCGGLVFAHEIGHNLGLHHDRYVTQGQEGAFPYAYGFVNVDSMTATRPGFRTVLSYNTRCLDRGGTCDRIPYYSNPDSLWNGQPMGRAGLEENALSVRQTAPVAAQFRAAAPQNALGAALAGAPTGRRPDCPDPTDLATCTASPAPVAFRAQSFTVPTAGLYYVQGDAAFDGILAVYEGLFNPAAPLDALVGYAAPDASAPAPRRLLLGADLVTGATYTLVAAGRTPATTGTATLRAYGIAPLTLLAVAGGALPTAAVLALSPPQPNPAGATARLTLTAPGGQAVEVVVVDALGRTVATLHRGAVEASGVRQLTVAGLAPGVYTVVARAGGSMAHQRVTIVGR